jgi:hypothetical protein
MLIAFSDVKGVISASLEAYISLIKVKVDVWGDAGGLWSHASGLHPQHTSSKEIE